MPATPRTLHVAVEHDGERVEQQDAGQLRRAADAHPLLAHAEAAHLHRMRAPWGAEAMTAHTLACLRALHMVIA